MLRAKQCGPSKGADANFHMPLTVALINLEFGSLYFLVF
jgi:hypothetical protein